MIKSAEIQRPYPLGHGMGGGGRHDHVTWTIYINFVPPSQGGSTLKLASIGQVVSEEKSSDIVDDDRRTDEGRPTMGMI